MTGAARRTLDADGLLVTPGFVDIHTHYDGQVTWDPLLTPSSWHGVTTVVMGNCGVGFAPVRPDRHDWLIGLMEGVEDIPGAALAEGIRWGWETFPEYLDALDAPALRRRRRRAGAARRGARLRDGRARRRRTSRRPPTTSRAMAALVREAHRGRRARLLDVAHDRCTARSTASRCPARSRPRTSCSASARALGELGRGVFELRRRRRGRRGHRRTQARDRLDAPALAPTIRPPGHVRAAAARRGARRCGASCSSTRAAAVRRGRADLRRRSRAGRSAC